MGTADHTEVYTIESGAKYEWHPVRRGSRLTSFISTSFYFILLESLGEVDLWRRALFSIQVLYLDLPAHQGGVSFSRDRRRRLAVGGQHYVTVFEVATGATLRKMPRDGRVPFPEPSLYLPCTFPAEDAA